MDRHLRIVEGKRATAADSGLPQERELIRAAQQGDASAFQDLYLHYKDRVYNLICYNLTDQHQAEDVLQTVFFKVFQALPFFRLESSFLTWIYSVAINECKNRKRQRRLFVPISLVSNSPHDADLSVAPDAQHATRQLNETVRRAVMELEPKLRATVVLKYLEDLSYEEIASILGCSSGTVASRLHRALLRLEKRLRPVPSTNPK